MNRKTTVTGNVPNGNPFEKGRRFEYRTRSHLSRLGWFVIRQPRSASPDLLALRKGIILLVECKIRGYIPPKQRRRMMRLTKSNPGAKAVLAMKSENGLLFRELSRRSSRYDKPFDPDPGKTLA